MSISADTTSFSISSRVSRPVDGALVTLRWAVIFLAWIAVWLITRTPVAHDFFLAWLLIYGAFNGLLRIGVHSRNLPVRLPVIALLGDMLFLSLLPLLPGVSNPLLILFCLFPVLVAAMRFGITAGGLVAFIVILPYEAAAILSLLPPALRDLVPLPLNSPVDVLTAFLPLLALLGVVVVVGYLTQREREAAVGAAQIELEELRKAFASARLFYESSDVLGSSANYFQILEVMLQAGVTGLPAGTLGQATPVGLALAFDPAGTRADKPLIVAASRGMDRADAAITVPGKQGVIARALQSGDPVSFARISHDPELAQFTSLRRMHSGTCYPLQSGLDVYGVVILATPSKQLPSEQHQRLMRAFINQAAIAMQNAQLYQNLRGERDRIVEAETSARARLARDLHDGPTQSLAALAMRLDFIRLLLDRDLAQAHAELEQARESVMRVGKELRGLLFTLRPLTLESQGLSAALKQFGERLRENDNVPIDVQPGNFGTELDSSVAATVFAIVEEAVNNARKHAQGAPIHVTVQQQDSSLAAIVRDEGPGFDLSEVTSNYTERGSLGMLNMRDRARLVDGQLNMESAPGRGTLITLLIPLAGRQGHTRVGTLSKA